MPTDYFRYFASGPESHRWGLALTAAGYTRVPAGSPYPPGRHPSDHHFDWEHGRELEALQIVFIASRRGSFESQATGRRVIEPGTAFAVLPKTWHRYRPDPATGWTESWLEVQGPTVEHLRRARIFAASAAVRKIELESGLEESLEALHQRARPAGPGFSAELAAAASDVTLDALAPQLGFSSGFHLSTAFKRAYGVSPEHWRRQLAHAMPTDEEREQIGEGGSDASPEPAD
jgi:AraC-like DNA-binding protein